MDLLKNEISIIVLVFFIVIYTFSVWGTSLLLWWDKCASRMDKPKIRELGTGFKTSVFLFVWTFRCSALKAEKFLKFI
jgi:hypothetical protein